MAFLEIDGTEWKVSSRQARIEVTTIGHVARAFAGNLRAVQHDQRHDAMGWQTIGLTGVQAAAFLALADGAFHDISGDCVGVATLQALVEIVDWDHVPNGTGHLTVFTFNLRFE